MKRYILIKIAHIVYYNYKLIIFISLLLTIISLLLGLRLKIKGDIVHLLPKQLPEVNTFLNSIEHFGASEYLFVVIESENENKLNEYENFLDMFAMKLNRSSFVSYVDYKKPSFEQNSSFKELFKYSLLYLDDNELEELVNRLGERRIKEQIRENKRLLISPFSSGIKKLVYEDPLNLSTIYRKVIERKNIFLHKTNPASDYYLSEDNDLLLMIIKPTKSAQNIKFTLNLIKEVKKTEKDTKIEFSNNQNMTISECFKNVNIGYAGSYALAFEDLNRIKKSLYATIITSFTGILLLFLFLYRGKTGAIFVISIPLIMGISWTWGLISLIIGNFNIITIALTAILVGLGVDFSIHIFHRYYSEINLGKSCLESLEIALVETGTGVVTCTFTTMIAFYSIVITRFQGFYQFGFILGTGIFFCLVSTCFVFSSLLVWRTKRETKSSTMLVSLPMLGVDKIVSRLIKFSRPVLISGFLLTLFMVWACWGIKFDSSTRSIRPKKSKVLSYQTKIMDKFGLPSNPIMMVIEESSVKQMLETNEEVTKTLNSSSFADNILYYDSIENYIPTISKQKKILKKIKTLKLDFKRINEIFKDTLLANGFKLIPKYDQYLSHIEELFKVSDMITPEKFNNPILQRLLSRYYYKKENVESVIYIYLKKTQGDNTKILDSFLNSIDNKIKPMKSSVKVSGINIVLGKLKGIIIKDTILASTVALIFIFSILYIHFRNIKYVVISLIPLITGIIWMLGTMSLFGVNLNFMNMLVTPMILGIGIDDGIHILHRYLEKGQKNIYQTMQQSGSAVMLTSLTTMVGFGSLVTADYPGIATMGLVSVLGVGFCLIMSVVILPVLMDVLLKHKKL